MSCFVLNWKGSIMVQKNLPSLYFKVLGLSCLLGGTVYLIVMIFFWSDNFLIQTFDVSQTLWLLLLSIRFLKSYRVRKREERNE